MMSLVPEPIVVETQPKPQVVVIWLHGLNADGHDCVPIVSRLNLPSNLAIRFVFPCAPEQPVKFYDNQIMRSWYDISGYSDGEKDMASIRRAERSLCSLIAAQVDQGIKVDNILLAGFSQGGALVLYTGLRYRHRLAGILSLSTYLLLSQQLRANSQVINRATPIFLAHGGRDDILDCDLGVSSKRCLEEWGCDVTWRFYPDLDHSIGDREVDDIRTWLMTVLKRS